MTNTFDLPYNGISRLVGNKNFLDAPENQKSGNMVSKHIQKPLARREKNLHYTVSKLKICSKMYGAVVMQSSTDLHMEHLLC